jgi:hypothetical protein
MTLAKNSDIICQFQLFRDSASAGSLPFRTQNLKAAIVFDRDVTVKVSSKNELNLQYLIKTVKIFVSSLFLSVV